MDREKFEKLMEITNNNYTKEEIKRIFNDCIDNNKDGYPRGHRNLIIVMEELSELQQEISKYLRDKGDRIGLIEETADVILGTIFVQVVCGISDEELRTAMDIKVNRLLDKLNSEGEFK